MKYNILKNGNGDHFSLIEIRLILAHVDECSCAATLPGPIISIIWGGNKCNVWSKIFVYHLCNNQFTSKITENCVFFLYFETEIQRFLWKLTKIFYMQPECGSIRDRKLKLKTVINFWKIKLVPKNIILKYMEESGILPIGTSNSLCWTDVMDQKKQLSIVPNFESCVEKRV